MVKGHDLLAAVAPKRSRYGVDFFTSFLVKGLVATGPTPQIQTHETMPQNSIRFNHFFLLIILGPL